MNKYVSLEDALTLDQYVDKQVVLEGRISDAPSQHLIGNFDGYPELNYFDVGKSQIVIYSKTRIETRETIKVFGKVIKLSGSHKNPGKKAFSFSEYQLLVDKTDPPSDTTTNTSLSEEKKHFQKQLEYFQKQTE